MKHLLITTIAAVMLVGCVTKQLQKTKAIPIQQPEPPTTEAPDISIHRAAAQGNIEVVNQHLNSGADVEARGGNGGAPLHFAALGGRKEIAELFLAKGADVNAQMDDGKTPLDSAIKRKHTETTALLRKHGGKTGEELEAEAK